MKPYFVLAAAILALAAQGAAYAQPAGYPSRPVRIVVPFPPAGANDVLARVIANNLSGRWPQPVVVENKPGASSIIGTEHVVKSAADGYTFVMGANTYAMIPWLFPKLPFDVLRDLAPVVLVATMPLVVAVRPGFPVNTIAELIRYAKANPGKVTYASSGSGSPMHVAAELFNSLTGTEMTHVPYKGGQPSWLAIFSGDVDLQFGTFQPAYGYMKGGKLRLIATGSSQRLSVLPALPTVAEAGVPGYEAGAWLALFAPALVSPDIVNYFWSESKKVLELPEVHGRLTEIGFEVSGASPAALGSLLARDLERWGAVIKARNISAN